MQSKAKVHYFKIWGRAEPIRMLLWYSKIPYEDVFYEMGEKFKDEKKKFEFGQVPQVEIDGHKLTQTDAIMNYICRKTGMVYADPYQQWKVDSICAMLQDIFHGYMPVYGAPKEKKMQALEKFLADVMEQKLPIFINRLEQEKSGYVAGDKLTVADIVYMCFYFSSWMDPKAAPERTERFKKTFDKFPKFVEYVTNIRDKHFKEYFEKVRIEPLM